MEKRKVKLKLRGRIGYVEEIIFKEMEEKEIDIEILEK